jgi:hypothetical protein
MSVLFAVAPPGERLEHLLQIGRQWRGAFHTSTVTGVIERQSRRVQKRPLQMRDGPDIAGHSSVDASVQRIADNRMTDGAQMHANLMCSARVNSHLAQRQAR